MKRAHQSALAERRLSAQPRLPQLPRVLPANIERLTSRCLVSGRLLARLAKIVDPDEDSLRLYPMPADSLAGVHVYGRPELTRIEDFFWVDKNSRAG